MLALEEGGDVGVGAAELLALSEACAEVLAESDGCGVLVALGVWTV